jgi:hypothetical protein
VWERKSKEEYGYVGVRGEGERGEREGEEM